MDALASQKKAFSINPILVLVWIITLLVSTLPNIFFIEVTGELPSWMLWAKLILLASVIFAGIFLPAVRQLVPYFAIFMVIYLAEEWISRFGLTPGWSARFGEGASFTASMLGTQILRMVVSFTVIAALLAMRYKPADFYLVKGDLDAPAAPVRWLGIKEASTWKKFGVIFSLCISLGLLVFLVLAGRPSLASLPKALPILPMVILLAAMNAFSEEMTYRASFLGTLKNVVPSSHALLLTAAFFGLGHFYGVPYGLIGVLMAGLLGWLLGKAMQETRGFFWPWFIHLLQDIMIFAFMGIGSIAAGGG